MKRRSFFTGILQSVAAIAVASSMEAFGISKQIQTEFRARTSLMRGLLSKAVEFNDCFDAKRLRNEIESETLTAAVTGVPDGYKVVINTGKWVDLYDPEVPESWGKWAFSVHTVADPI